MKRNNLFSGSLILAIGSVLAKLFSAIYRIGLTRILGGEGIGVYQLVFPLYSLCVVLATAGLPMAISKVIVKNPNNAKVVVKKCLIFTSLISLVLAFVLIVFSGGLSTLQGEERLSICYILLAPTILIVSASSVLRGYFQGKENFIPSSVSNICEQFVKLVVGLVLSFVLIKISLMASIIGAMISIVVSEIVSIAILLLYYKKQSKSKSSNKKLIIDTKELMRDVLPITATNVIMPIAVFIDSLLVVNLLSVNFTTEMSIFLYGVETGAVSSLVSLPTIFSFAIASVILPSLTGGGNIINKNHKVNLAIRVVLLITVPCVLCFLFIPDRLIGLLYGNKLNGYGVGGANLAFRLLAISGVGIVFLAINQIYSSSLQAIDKRMVTVRNLTIGVVVKFIIELIFMMSVKVNIFALSIANTACYMVAFILNHIEMKKYFNIKLNFGFAVKLLVSNFALMIMLSVMLSLRVSALNTILALTYAGVVYLICVVLLNFINRKDNAMMKYKIK